MKDQKLMSESNVGAPFRHPIPWKTAEYYDEDALDSELRRVFDICHGCRRCFNLCDSFPRLFDLIDESESGELDSVDSSLFGPVIDACTLCDMCFMTKCPYVPPHEFDLDFPHLMLRARAAKTKKEGVPFSVKQLTKTDRNGKLCKHVAPVVNWASKRKNITARKLIEKTVQIHQEASLPKFHSKTLIDESGTKTTANLKGPAFGKKVVLYATCFGNYNNPKIGQAAIKVLSKNGVESTIVYPGCCGMPQLEQGNIPEVLESAKKVSAELQPWIESGYDVITLVPSCALMMKFEWPLLLPENEDIKRLSDATKDLSEYVIELSKKEGLEEGLRPIQGGVSMHLACHARAQNMGQKGVEMLKLIPDTEITVIERCSGHGGSLGFMKEYFDVGVKLGAPVARKVLQSQNKHIVSECPLAREHIVQVSEKYSEEEVTFTSFQHPIELIALSYGLK